MALIDLHCHTARYSFDGRLESEELIERLMATNIQGLVITEHNKCWPREELDDLLATTGGAEAGLRLWAGQEVRVAIDGRPAGDLLVYGPERPMADGTPIERVIEEVDQVGGFTIAAHLGVPGKGLGALAGDYPITAVETWNGRYGAAGAKQSKTAAEGLHLPATGGSDAHEPSQVGQGATEFPGTIDRYSTFSDLREALTAGRCRPWKPQPSDRLRSWWQGLGP